MKIYLDYVFFINFLFDFILLLGISTILKRNVKYLKIFFGSIIGGLSGFLILLNISSSTFFLLKMLLGLIMIITTFRYKNIKYTMNNFFYLIILSILLGGTLYLLNIEASKTVLGNIILSDKTFYVIALIITSSIATTIYTKYINKTKKDEQNKYKTVLYLENKKINLTGFLDTGNTLIYKKRPVLILNKDININIENKKIFYIPFRTLNSTGIIKCIKLNKVFIEKKGFFKNIYLALSSDKFHLKDADIILNINLWEEDNDKNNKKSNRKIKKLKRK